MPVPARHQPTGVVQPGEEPFDDPAPHVAAERTTILSRGAHAVVAMRRDPVDPEVPRQVRIKLIAVIGAVPNPSSSQRSCTHPDPPRVQGREPDSERNDGSALP